MQVPGHCAGSCSYVQAVARLQQPEVQTQAGMVQSHCLWHTCEISYKLRHLCQVEHVYYSKQNSARHMARSVAELVHARTKNRGQRLHVKCAVSDILCLQPVQCGGIVLKYVISMSAPELPCSFWCTNWVRHHTPTCAGRMDTGRRCVRFFGWISTMSISGCL